MAVLVTIQAFAIGLLGLLVAGLLRSHAEILRSLHDLGAGLNLDSQPGSQGPSIPTNLREPSSTAGFDLVGTTPRGEATAVGVVGAEQGTLLAFLSSGCTSCNAFWEAFATDSDLAVPGGARLVVVTKDPDEESQSSIVRLAPADVTVVMSTRAWRDYEVPVAPYFLYVDGSSGQVVGEGAGTSWAQVSSLLSQAVGDAGLAGTDTRTNERRRRRLRAQAGDAAREKRAEEKLLSAGIHPGHPSLYPERETQADQSQR
jgi:hypothetical protein